jgi:DNA recombination protein RmuC
VEGVHYELQANFKDDEHNNLRPDVVLKLPEKKRIVIDAKVSLTAYAEWCATDDATARNSLMEAHLASVRKHVNELSTKKYQQLVDSPDFVVMFIPNEPAFLVALQHDNTIWSEAYKKKVIISSPTNLFAILKLVDDLWRRNDRFLNQEEIIKRATTLFEQLVNFTSSLQGVGASLDQARAKYDEALKRLCTGRNNIVRQGERLRMLGLTPTKQFSQQLLDATDDLPDDNTQSSLPSNSSDPA